MTGKEFEKLVLDRATKDEENGLYTLSPNGTRAVWNPTTRQWRPLKSKPDFEGAISPSGRQFLMDAKVMAGASLSINEDKAPKMQREYLLRRWRFGVPSCFLVYCEERKLKKSTQPSMTVVVPTDPELPFWKLVLDEPEKSHSLHREAMLEMGIVVHWTKANPQDRKALPNFLPAIRELARRIDI